MFLCFCVFVFWTLISIRQVDEECCSSEREEKLILASLRLWKAKFLQKDCKPLLSFLLIIITSYISSCYEAKLRLLNWNSCHELNHQESDGRWKWFWKCLGSLPAGGRKQQIVNGRFVSLPKMDVCVSKVCLVEFFFANCIYILLWMSEIMKEVENDWAKAYLILYAGNMKTKVIWKRNDGL